MICRWPEPWNFKTSHSFKKIGQIHIDLQTRNFQLHIKIFLQFSTVHNQTRQLPRSREQFDLFWCNHLCSEDMFKCNDLFQGQLPVTKEQLEPVLFDAPTSIQRTIWSWEEVGGTICSWTLDKLKHTKLSLVCLGFTSMNVPLCLDVQVRVHLGNIQMTGVSFGGHVSWVLCSVYLD
jgi:hypothetical protein